MAIKIFGESNQNAVNNDMKVEPDGSINVNIQDQISPPLDLYFQQLIGDITTLAAAASIDDNTITVTDITDFSVGDYVGISEQGGRFYFGEALAIAGNVITLDTPLDFAFLNGAFTFSTTRNLNVVGSLAAPETFSIFGAGVGTGVYIDITRINVSIISAAQPDDGKFGSLARLTNGIVLRRVDGDTRNIWNAKDNADLGIISGIDTVYSERSVPLGSYGTKSRISYAGTEKHGVAIRLAPGDSMEMIIQDDLSALTSFRIMAQGHIVVNGEPS